ncbi:hypothetical protein BT93_F1888 [Corymbia citriodora subsp. variegata]|nr:hypothetical protein BT93_F1888 [Corymbia citriodora subsp. variegata]
MSCVRFDLWSAEPLCPPLTVSAARLGKLLQQAVLASYVAKLFPYWWVAIRHDKNGDSKISCDELRQETQAAMSKIDKDGDGFIYLNKFTELILCGGGGRECGAKKLKDTFDLHNLDGNGVISASELHVALKKLGQKCSLRDCRKMISSVHLDGDGNVRFEEFEKMMPTVTSDGTSS